MPEGPEIRRAADKVFHAIGDGPLQGVELTLPGLTRFERRLSRSSVTGIDTHGKAMLTKFANGLTLYSHNQLYGVWYTTRAGGKPSTSRALRVALHTAKGSAWLYSATDVEVLTEKQLAKHPFLLRLGPDILDPSLTEAGVVAQLNSSSCAGRSLGALYLDQGFLAGNGNYLRSEILFFAGCHYAEKPRDLSAARQRRLARVTLALARRSYRTGGLTNPPRKVAELRKKGWRYERRRFAVFGRAGQRCHACGSKIVKTTVGSRRLYFCTTCQPAP
ncbi:MAG: endonuclease VIII [Pseudomonadota bacterium]